MFKVEAMKGHSEIRDMGLSGVDCNDFGVVFSLMLRV